VLCHLLQVHIDTVGAFVGPLAAIGLMVVTVNNFTAVFWMAVIPAFLAFGLMIFGVEEPKRKDDEATRPRLHWSDTKRLSAEFWAIVAVASVLTSARFSEAFLVLRSQNVGLPIALVPTVMVVMNIIYALAAYPAGALSDILGRNGMLALGIVFLFIADIVLAFGTTIPPMMLGVVFWGLHMGFTQGLLATLVSDTAPVELRGTAFGVFNFVAGLAMLVASVVAGALWDAYGAAATFVTAAGFTIVALIGFLIIRDPNRRGSSADARHR
jgi:MFS family permease